MSNILLQSDSTIFWCNTLKQEAIYSSVCLYMYKIVHFFYPAHHIVNNILDNILNRDNHSK